jgi:LysM repeat protein
MAPIKIVLLSLGASAAVVVGVLAWQGLLPGLPALQPSPEPAVATAPAGQPRDKAAAPQAPAAKPQPLAPQFDTVRVEPTGEAIVAGHGEPNAKMALMNGDKVLGEVQTDSGGDFVIIPNALPPGNYVLALRSTSGRNAPVLSQQTIIVSIPAKGQTGVVVALSEPGKPSRLLTDPTAASPTPPAEAAKEEPQPPASPEAAKPEPAPAATAAAPPAPAEQAPVEQTPSAQKPSEQKPSVAIKTAEVDNGGFYAAGFAPAGTHVRIYLNGSLLTDVIADADGEWSLTVKKGVTSGHYVVRADAVDAKGSVVARAEVPFDVPLGVAEAPKPNATMASGPAGGAAAPAKEDVGETAAMPKTGAAAKPSEVAKTEAPKTETPPAQSAATAARPASAGHAVVPEINTATVSRGDSLWRISRKTLGEGVRYTLIYQANEGQIRNPNLIYPGQVFVLPQSASHTD